MIGEKDYSMVSVRSNPTVLLKYSGRNVKRSGRARKKTTARRNIVIQIERQVKTNHILLHTIPQVANSRGIWLAQVYPKKQKTQSQAG
jgi:hypothetical protein